MTAMDLYKPSSFTDVGDELAALKREEAAVTQLDIVRKHFDNIEDALTDGVPIGRIHEVMSSHGLKVQLSTFRASVIKVRKERLKEERRAKNEAKRRAKAAATKPQKTASSYPTVDPSTVTAPPKKIHAHIVED